MLLPQEPGEPDTALFAVDLYNGGVELRQLKATGLGTQIRMPNPFRLPPMGLQGLVNDELLLDAGMGALASCYFGLPEECDFHAFAVPASDAATANRLSDTALTQLRGTLLSEGHEVAMNDNQDEALVFFAGRASSLMLSMTADGKAEAFSIAPHLGEDNEPAFVEGGTGTIMAFRIQHEGIFQAPPSFFERIRKVLFRKGKRRRDLDSDTMGQVADEIGDWFWEEAGKLADPLLAHAANETLDAANVAPLRFIGGDETRMIQLLEWVLQIDRARNPTSEWSHALLVSAAIAG